MTEYCYVLCENLGYRSIVPIVVYQIYERARDESWKKAKEFGINDFKLVQSRIESTDCTGNCYAIYGDTFVKSIYFSNEDIETMCEKHSGGYLEVKKVPFYNAFNQVSFYNAFNQVEII